MSLFAELKRRNVFRVGIAYTIVAWLIAQVLELVLDSFGAPDWAMKTLLVVLMKFTMAQFLSSMKAAGKAFMFKSNSPEDLIAETVELADAARKGGFLAPEEAEITNPFLQKAVNMLVDGHDQAVVKAALSAANRRSQSVARTKPRPAQGPLMAASRGLRTLSR